MKTSTKFLTCILLISLMIVLVGACQQTHSKKNKDTIAVDSIPQKKEWRRFTLTNNPLYDSVQYFLAGTDTIQRIQWKNGSKDGICQLGWVISHTHFIYPDHSDTIYTIDTAFNSLQYEYWNEKKLYKKITFYYFENKQIESIDTAYINGKDTLNKVYTWYDTGRLHSKETTLNRMFIDSSIILASNGNPLLLEFYNKKSQLVRGVSYDDNGNITDERYEDLKTGEIIYRIKDGKKVK